MDAWFIAPALALVAGVLALAPLGERVLERGVVFIDLAVAQAAAAAALTATVVGGHPPWAVVQGCAIAGAFLVVAIVAALARWWPAQREALIGLVYVGCACAALLTAQIDAHGGEHLHALLAADVLWSGWPQVGLLAACAALVGGVRRRLGSDLWFYATFALVCGLAVQVLGLFVVFAALIAPGLWQRAGLGFVAVCALSVAAAMLGLGASWVLNAPSGPLVAFCLALCGLASAVRRGGARSPAQDKDQLRL